MIGAALDAVDPARAVHRHMHRAGNWLIVDGLSYALNAFDEVILIAIGKAAVPMALASAERIGDRLGRGVVVTKYGHAATMATAGQNILKHVKHVTVLESAHPVPDENSAHAGELVVAAIAGCTERSLVVACISGGASALMVAPHPGIRLSTLQVINDALLKSGADIREMNIVRSRLDRLKGGGLARLSAPGQVLGLILSDVIGDPLDVIASGLTNDPRARNVLVGNNTQACDAAADAARKLGYEARVVTTELRGEARERGREIARAISAAQPRTCLIYGGETTVTIQGNGKGGRNQELALAAALELDKLGKLDKLTACPTCVAAFGTDGTDGPTDAAGALATPDTVAHAAALGLHAEEFLARNDSYHFFQALGDLITTGPTGTNVADVVIAFRDE